MNRISKLPVIKIESEDPFFVEQIKRIIYRYDIAIDIYDDKTSNAISTSIIISDDFPCISEETDEIIYVLSSDKKKEFDKYRGAMRPHNVKAYCKNNLKESVLANYITKIATKVLSTAKYNNALSETCRRAYAASEELDELKKAIALSKDAQRAVMNLDMISKSGNFDTSLVYVPYKEISGDVIFAREIYDRLFIMMADVTDHGILAGMYGATLYALANNYIQTSSIVGLDIDSWAQYMGKASRMFYPESLSPIDPMKNLFAANVTFAVIDMKKCIAQFMFYGTGQEPPIIIDSSKDVHIIDTREAIKKNKDTAGIGAPLAGDASSAKIYWSRFFPGSSVTLYSDGATEVFLDPDNPRKDAKKMYTSDKIRDSVKNAVANDKTAPNDIIKCILHDTTAYSIGTDIDDIDDETGMPNVTDDLTIACIKWKGREYD